MRQRSPDIERRFSRGIFLTPKLLGYDGALVFKARAPGIKYFAHLVGFQLTK